MGGWVGGLVGGCGWVGVGGWVWVGYRGEGWCYDAMLNKSMAMGLCYETVLEDVAAAPSSF